MCVFQRFCTEKRNAISSWTQKLFVIFLVVWLFGWHTNKTIFAIKKFSLCGLERTAKFLILFSNRTRGESSSSLGGIIISFLKFLGGFSSDRWFFLDARAPSKPNSECGNWQLAAKKATRTRTRKSAKRQRQRRQQLWSALVGRQRKKNKKKGQEIKAYIHTYVGTFSLWQVCGPLVLAVCELQFCQQLQSTCCWCAFVALSPTTHRPRTHHSLFANVSVSCGYMYLYLYQSICMCVGFARVSPKDSGSAVVAVAFCGLVAWLTFPFDAPTCPIWHMH